MNDEPKTACAATDSALRPQVDEPREYLSAELFAGARRIIIRHGGEPYRLLITKNDRLVLQK